MPIRTLKDLQQSNDEDKANDGHSYAASGSGPVNAPMPNPWGGAGRSLATGAVVRDEQADLEAQRMRRQQQREEQQRLMQNDPAVKAGMQDDAFWSYNLQHVPQGQIKWYHIILQMCCPCFAGPICSPNRRKDWIRLLLSFIFWITLVQIIMFIVEVSVGGFDSNPFRVFPPQFGPPAATLYQLGAKAAASIKYQYQIWRLFTPIFLHSHIWHLLFNMLAQITLCLGFERRWTILRVVPIYFIAGIGGNLASCVIMPQSLGVGASGAIIGLIGTKCAWVVIQFPKMTMQARIFHLTSTFMALFWVFLMSFSQYVDWSAHLFGLYVGFFCGFVVFANLISNKILRAVSIIIGLLGNLAFFLTFSLVFALVPNLVPPSAP